MITCNAQNSEIIVSIATVIISLVAVELSLITWRSQVRHNKNSVMPIINIIVGDYEKDIYVRLVVYQAQTLIPSRLTLVDY